MNIYVSNLSFDVNDSDLKELFEKHGQVSSAKVITDRMSGRSRGFGFVEMSDDSEGQKAIDDLNGAEFSGKALSVSIAKPKTDRPQGGGGYSRGGGGGGRSYDNRGSRY